MSFSSTSSRQAVTSASGVSRPSRHAAHPLSPYSGTRSARTLNAESSSSQVRRPSRPEGIGDGGASAGTDPVGSLAGRHIRHDLHTLDEKIQQLAVERIQLARSWRHRVDLPQGRRELLDGGVALAFPSPDLRESLASLQDRVPPFPGAEARWVSVAPAGAETEVILYLPDENWEHYKHVVGKSQPLTFNVADIAAFHADLAAKGVTFVQEPDVQPWGTFAIIEDSEGNKILLVQQPGA